MPLDSYAGLQATVLQWLGRPGDPAVVPFVPDMVRLAEAEASRRLRVVDAERVQLGLPVAAGSNLILPGDCWQVRRAYWGGVQLEFLAPGDPVFNAAAGVPRWYTLLGVNTGGNAGESGLWGEFVLVLGPGPSQDGSVDLVYQVGVPPLSESRPTNWLLALHPDAYLFATLVEAELFTGNDERGPLWLQRRDAAFASIEAYDRKTRWSGPLQIRPDFVDLGGGGGSGISPSPAPLTAGAVRVVGPISGATVVMNAADDSMLVTSGPLAALTILLPPTTAEREVEVSFTAPVTALTVRDSAGVAVPSGPTSAYGPGAGLVFRWVAGTGFVYWK